jgi:Insertion element 4 transposase N-terminal/Transposase DDE domain
MELGETLRAVAAAPDARSESFELFSRSLDIGWVRRALHATGTASIRRRKLPAEYVVWLVIGMALLRDRSIDEVVHHLDLVLPDLKAAPQRGGATRGAVIEARGRLGWSALAVLFIETARRWATEAANAQRWQGLAVYGVDGTTLRTPDTEENEQTFGRPRSGRSDGGYPQLRLVALMVLRGHLLADFAVGPFDTGEQSLAQKLWEGLPDDSLCIVDKGFINYLVFHSIQTQGTQRHWLCRAKANLKWQVVRSLGAGDDLVEIPLNRALRKAHPELPERLPARAIRYQRRGFRPQTLVTSLLDPQVYPAQEIVALYHERWELEIGFDEIKTHTLDRTETLRSKTPDRILQEIWGLGIAYNLVRRQMLRVADRLHLPASRISYRHSVMLVRNFLLSAWLASPGVLPKRLEHLHEEMALLVLPKRRPRSYARVVKIKMSGYRKKPIPKRPSTLRKPLN